MNRDLDETLERALAPSAAERAPSDDLMRRLRGLAREAPRKKAWRPGRLLPLAMVGATVGAVVATTMLPAKASAKSFDLVVAAAQRIDAFQFSIVSGESPKLEALTIAGRGGHVYLRAAGDVAMEIGPSAMSFYERDENKVVRMKFGGLVDPATAAQMLGDVQSGIAEGLDAMDLKKTLREYRQRYGPGGVRVSPTTRENGHLVYHVVLASPSEPERVEMTVDDATDLPETIDVEARDGARWRPVVRMELRFGAQVDPGLLRSSIPAGAKVEEIDLGLMVGGAMKEAGKALESLGEELKAKGGAPREP